MRIILASGSPRRSELLRQFGVDIEIIPSDIEEKSTFLETPEQIVMALSFEKAYDIAKKNPKALVIGSDTIVYLDGVLGKPISEEEAYHMLKQLSGRSHEVYTGFAVVCEDQNKKIVDFVKTEVRFLELSEEIIWAYIKSKEPLDKAGAYGIQGLGALLIDSFSGDYFSVMGLPLSRLNQVIDYEFGINLLTKEGL